MPARQSPWTLRPYGLGLRVDFVVEDVEGQEPVLAESEELPEEAVVARRQDWELGLGDMVNIQLRQEGRQKPK